MKVTVLLCIHKMRNQRASPERGGARRAEGLTMKSAIFLFLLPVNSNKEKTLSNLNKVLNITFLCFLY